MKVSADICAWLHKHLFNTDLQLRAIRSAGTNKSAHAGPAAPATLRHARRLMFEKRWRTYGPCGKSTIKSHTLQKHCGSMLFGSIEDTNIRCESGPISTTDKRSPVGGLALDESFESTKTLLEWLHFDANVSDALTMFDQRAMDLIWAFLNNFTWSIVFNPTITSAKQVRAQTTQLKKRT